MPEDVTLQASTLGLLCGLNAVTEALALAHPDLGRLIVERLEAKRQELRASPDHAAAAPMIEQMIRALTQSPAALRHVEPQGKA